MTMKPHPSEQEAAATLARECTDHAAVILWCADRVRSVDDSETAQDAADHLHGLSTRAQVDSSPVTDRAAIIRWCAQQIHSMGGDADVERAAEYLDDLATEALWVQHDEAVSVRQEGEQRSCGYTKRHPSHTFMRLEVLFQCPGQHETEDER
ncbi:MULTISPECIES: hypothetical protein [unclassified Streptomyces]|uniref:hypothetical protein n=2 Tax=Streptomyces TaxID=1883 RepID=UPI000851C94B|nr:MULTISPECIES: hypothetical protein [unclassified Streptomyces]